MKSSIRALAATLALSCFLPASSASAGGFYLLDRGTRPLGRGGAFVAGADDPGAIWYNPAGIGFSGNQLLIDGTLTFLNIDYTRIDSGGMTQPTVHGTNAAIPIPTIAGTFDLGLEHFTFGLALMAPNAALLDYPDQLSVDGMSYPAPQRYSLLSMQGSAIATVSAAVAWTPLPNELSIGLGVHAVLGSFAARVALSACEGTVCTFPEDPDYDGIAQLTLAPLFTASAVLGVTWNAGPVRLGASVSTPFSLSGNAAIQVRPPSAAAFDGAVVRSREGDCGSVPDQEVVDDAGHPCRETHADVNLDFPWVVRFGVELLAIENLRLEASVVWETWSVQQQVSVRPRNVWIIEALGFLDYEMGAIDIPRNMRDTVSVRLGAEYTIDGWLQLRIGGYYENGAFDDPWLSALTIDSDKIVVGAGGSVRVHEGIWLDLLVGYAHLFSRQVRNSQVTQANPIRPSLPDMTPDAREPGDPVYVGNGDYNFVAPFVGLGLRWQADWVAAHPAVVEPEPEASETEATPAAEPETIVDPTQPWYRQSGTTAPTEPETPEVTPEAPGPSEEVEPAPSPQDRRRGRRERRRRRSRSR